MQQVFEIWNHCFSKKHKTVQRKPRWVTFSVFLFQKIQSATPLFDPVLAEFPRSYALLWQVRVSPISCLLVPCRKQSVSYSNAVSFPVESLYSVVSHTVGILMTFIRSQNSQCEILAWNLINTRSSRIEYVYFSLLNTLVRHAHCLSTPRRCLTKTAKRLMIQSWPLDWAVNWSFHLA